MPMLPHAVQVGIQLLVLWLLASVCIAAVWMSVVRGDREREEVEDALWVRSIDDYRERARQRAASLPPVPDPLQCHGRIRRPLGAVPEPL